MNDAVRDPSFRKGMAEAEANAEGNESPVLDVRHPFSSNFSTLSSSLSFASLSYMPPDANYSFHWDNFTAHQAMEATKPSNRIDLLACAFNPMQVMDKTVSSSFQPHSKGSCWDFTEDVPGKPGWICTSASTPVSSNEHHAKPSVSGDTVEYSELPTSMRTKDHISFTLKTSCRLNTILVSVLRSYTTAYGRLHCWVDSPEQIFSLDTHWNQKVSQSEDMVIRFSSHTGRCSEGAVEDEHLLVCYALDGKIKLDGIVSC